ncbi:MAG: UvrD-helicase domain-containing protein [Bacteroidetes bacterium]|nr:UvrD-helicase domain-containing protein [Bacteroidota bacterium]
MTDQRMQMDGALGGLAGQDAAARLRCIDPATSFIVQAPAGSGKTELLIQRFLSLLATVQAPEEIVAVTFTRKAAAEMRVRILGALDAAAMDAPAEAHARRTWDLARAALVRDAELHWQLARQPSRLRILTIDALNGWITRQMPWISGMGAQPAIADDARELYREAVRSVLFDDRPDSRTARELTSLLLHLDNRTTVIEDLLIEMLAIRDQWHELLDEREDRELHARAVIEHSLQRIVEEHLAQTQHQFPEGLLDAIVDLARTAASNLASDPQLPDPGVLEPLLADDRVPGSEAEFLPVWQGIAHFLLTADGGLRKARGINRKLGFPPGAAGKEEFQHLLGMLDEYPAIHGALRRVRALPASTFADAQWEILGSMLHVLGRCLSELRVLFARRATVDHAEIAEAALRALGTDLDPTDLAMILEYRIRHLLIDEFQDTSSSQYRLIGLLTAGWAAEDGHTLFLVGDPMQSIYRFREAEVGLFLRVWEERRIGSVQMTPLRLYRNFRSQARIVEWVNHAFSSIMPAEDNVDTGAVRYVRSEPTIDAEDEGVILRPVFSGSREDEATTIAELIREAVKGTLCGPVTSIGVLVRARSHLGALVPRLRSEGIAFQAVEIEQLARHPAVRDVLALSRALAHEGDRTAWLAILRAPWCGVMLADIHQLCADVPRATVLECLMDEDRIERCSEDARRRLVRLREVMREAHAQRGRKTFRRLVEGCWIALGGPATVDGQGEAAAMACFDLLESCETGGDLTDHQLLAERVADLYAPTDQKSDRTVQLMTIHKAKGLQFDVVIVPRLDGVPRADQERLLLWMERPSASGVDFIIAPMRERGAEHDPTYRYVRQVQAEKGRHEHLRLLYVASTRAKKRLVLTAPMRTEEKPEGPDLRTPSKNAFLGFLWPLFEDSIRVEWESWVKNGYASSAKSDAPAEGIPMRRFPSDWQPQLPEKAGIMMTSHNIAGSARETRDVFWTAGEDARVTGVVIHRLLAQIGMTGLQWWTTQDETQRFDTARMLFRHEGRPDIPDERIGQAVRAIDNMLDDPRGSWILASHEHAESELKLIGTTGEGREAVVLDRTFIDDDGTRWIIDFKNTEHEGGERDHFLDLQVRRYTEQLRRYARIMRVLDPRPLRIALYFPLLREFREIPCAESPDDLRTP